MRIGIQQSSLGNVTTARALVRANRAGADGIGLCYRTAQDAAELGAAEHVSRLRKLVDCFAKPVTGLYLGFLSVEPSLIGPLLTTGPSRELVIQAISLATVLGRPAVVLPFYGRNRIELPQELIRAGEALQELAELAADRGVILAVESTLHTGQLLSLLDACNSEALGVCLDTGDVTASRYDAAGMIRSLGASRLAQVHLKDVCAVSGLPPDFNIRLGRGDVRFQEIAQALQAVGYDGWIVLETPPGDDKGAIAAANVRFARDLFRTRPIPGPVPATAGQTGSPVEEVSQMSRRGALRR